MKIYAILFVLFSLSLGCGPLLGSSQSEDQIEGLNAVMAMPYVDGTMTRNRLPAGIPRGSRRFLVNGVPDHILTNAVVDDHPLDLLDTSLDIPMPGLHYNERAGFKMPACYYKDARGWGCTHVLEGDLEEIVDLPDPGFDIDERITEQPAEGEEHRKCFRKEVTLSPQHSRVTEIVIMWYDILKEGCPDLKAPKTKTALASRR